MRALENILKSQLYIPNIHKNDHQNEEQKEEEEEKKKKKKKLNTQI